MKRGIDFGNRDEHENENEDDEGNKNGDEEEDHFSQSAGTKKTPKTEAMTTNSASTSTTSKTTTPLLLTTVMGNSSLVLKSFTEMWEQQVLTDCILKIGEEEVKAHRCVLAQHSAVFRAMFERTDMKEAQTGMIEISDSRSESVKAMVKYFYTGNVDESALQEFSEELFAVAHKYEVFSLLVLCERYMAQTIDEKNIVSRFNFVGTYEAPFLKRGCIDYICSFGSHFLRSNEWNALKTECSPLAFELLETAFIEPLGTREPRSNYAFEVRERFLPVTFPADAASGEGVPKNMRRVLDLQHGQVVTALKFSADRKRVFTCGKSVVKTWAIGKTEDGKSLLTAEMFNENNNNSNSSSSSSSNSSSSTPVIPSPAAISSVDVWSQQINDNRRGYITTCKLLPDSSTLFVGGDARNICLVDVERGEVKQRLDCGTDACLSLAISSEGKLCFSALSNGTIVVWDVQSGQRVTQLEGHSGRVNCVDLSGSGKQLWSGGADGTVRCWDVGACEQIDWKVLEGPVFSLSCCPTSRWIAVGLSSQDVQVLNTRKLQEKYVLMDHQSGVISLKYAHNGKWFVSTGKDCKLNCWRSPYGFRLLKKSEENAVLGCDISSDDRFLATAVGLKATIYKMGF